MQRGPYNGNGRPDVFDLSGARDHIARGLESDPVAALHKIRLQLFDLHEQVLRVIGQIGPGTGAAAPEQAGDPLCGFDPPQPARPPALELPTHFAVPVKTEKFRAEVLKALHEYVRRPEFEDVEFVPTEKAAHEMPRPGGRDWLEHTDGPNGRARTFRLLLSAVFGIRVKLRDFGDRREWGFAKAEVEEAYGRTFGGQ